MTGRFGMTPKSQAVILSVCVAISACGSEASEKGQWRYVPEERGQGAAAELGRTFRIRCVQSRHDLFFEYFPGDGAPGEWTKEARENGIELILFYPASKTETIYLAHGPATASALTGTLPLTADLADEIAEAPTLMLYGENGPANRTFGGAAAALRRIVRECAPSHSGPRSPRVEQGHAASEW